MWQNSLKNTWKEQRWETRRGMHLRISCPGADSDTLCQGSGAIHPKEGRLGKKRSSNPPASQRGTSRKGGHGCRRVLVLPRSVKHDKEKDVPLKGHQNAAGGQNTSLVEARPRDGGGGVWTTNWGKASCSSQEIKKKKKRQA